MINPLAGSPKTTRWIIFLTTVTLVAVAGPGEKGRPKVIPAFKEWEGSKIFYRKPDALPPTTTHLEFFDLNGNKSPLESLWKERPVLLVHTSLTCPVSRDNCPHLDRIAEQFAGEIDVVLLYTREAHPVGSPSPYSEGGSQEWLTDRNLAEDILADEPQSISERIQRAKEYQTKMELKSRLVVDTMNNAIWKFFGGGPNTAVLITPQWEIRTRQGWFQALLHGGRYSKHKGEQAAFESP